VDLHLWNRGKSLKIPKGRSETLNRRETYNTMTNRKGQTMIHKTLHRKLNWNTNPIKNREWSHVLLNGKQFLLRMRHPSCYSCYSVTSHKFGLWLRQTEHIRGHLWHRYCVTFGMSLWQPQTFKVITKRPGMNPCAGDG
jgi:hypothetical protein